MDTIRSPRWILAAVIGAAIIGCAPAGATVSPSRTPAPSSSVQPSVGPTSMPSSSFPTASAAVAPPALRVECDGTSTLIPTPLVRTRPDGIHITYVNRSGLTLDLAIDDAFGGGLGDSIPVVGGSVTYTFGTGSYRLTCGTTSAAFSVVDPDGLYTPYACTDPGSGTSGPIDHAAGATGPRGSLLDVARAQLRGLEPGDVVERAGYPEAVGEQHVRVVRDGEVQVVVSYTDDGQGGWLLSLTRTCPGSTIIVSPAVGATATEDVRS